MTTATKPVIGINGDFRPAKKDVKALSWYHTGYYDSLVAADALPSLVPPLADDADLKQYLNTVDGIILTGCSHDLDPVRLGMQKHPATRVMPNRREDFDRRLCQMAVDMKMPILAIGSGMQTLNVICGGTLFQHISEDVPKALLHRDNVESELRHVIDIVPGSRIDQIYGPGEIRVNSQHHMAVDQPAPQFRVTATCPDGVVEAIEAIDPEWYAVGIQWHPENASSSALDMQVFESLVEACQGGDPVILSINNAARKAA